MKLTPKQKAFADYYIETGNASEAARRAGYSEKTAGGQGAENLRKPQISAYIAERMSSQDRERCASADEVLQFYTAVMRGEVKDQFGIEASLADRIRAGENLMKRHDKAQTSEKREPDELSESLEEFGKKLKSDDK